MYVFLVFWFHFFGYFINRFCCFVFFESSIYVHSDVFLFVASINNPLISIWIWKNAATLWFFLGDVSVKMYVCLLFHLFFLDRPPFLFRSSTVSVLDRPHFYSRFKSAWLFNFGFIVCLNYIVYQHILLFVVLEFVNLLFLNS